MTWLTATSDWTHQTAGLIASQIGWPSSRGGAPALDLEPEPTRQSWVAIIIAVSVLLLVLELVRRRKLREEYSILWVLTASLLLILAFSGGWVLELTRLIGATTPTSTLFLGALLFLMLVALQFSVRVSKLTYRNKALTQRLALLEDEVRSIRKRRAGLGKQSSTGDADGEESDGRLERPRADSGKRSKGGAA